ncbi:MAG: NAD(P)H-hydrate dehydratase [Planctomycetes bacterium]|nr:NAD(P)H-hydrate dehydratase [Planctomycetota bacterium]
MKIIKKLPVIKSRRPDTHKGDYGKVLIIAGSRGMSGAAYLSAQSAIRSGAGLVYLAIPSSQQPILATKLTCVITQALAETTEGTVSKKAIDDIKSLLQFPSPSKWELTLGDVDAVGIGPGLSRHPQTMEFVRSVLPLFTCPAVIDADGINALVNNIKIIGKMRSAILTPHAAEMARLLKTTPTKIQFNRMDSAVEAAKRLKSIVILKGYKTIVTDGENIYINTTGNPGMATAGSGDVLTGMIASFVAQKLSPFEASQLAVYLHGLAGDMAAKKFTEHSLIATDIMDYIPEAIKQFI